MGVYSNVLENIRIRNKDLKDLCELIYKDAASRNDALEVWMFKPEWTYESISTR